MVSQRQSLGVRGGAQADTHDPFPVDLLHSFNMQLTLLDSYKEELYKSAEDLKRRGERGSLAEMRHDEYTDSEREPFDPFEVIRHNIAGGA